MSIAIRRARPREAERLTRIALAAKRYWGYPDTWLERWRDALTITPQYIRRHHVYVAEESSERLGFFALVCGDDRALLEHLWVDPASIGRGVGRELFAFAIQLARTQGITRVLIEADPNAEGFYARMGAVRVGELSADMDGIRRVLPCMEVSLTEERPLP